MSIFRNHLRRVARSVSVFAAGVALLSASLGLPGQVAAAGTPVALEFTVQPGGGPELASFAQQPVVRIVDASGDTVTTSHLAVATSLVGTGGVLYCNALPLQALAGVATFAGCAVNGPGTYRMRVTAYRLTGAVSDPFTVGPPGPVPAAQLRLDIGDATAGKPFTATAGGPVWFDLRYLVVDWSGHTITTGPGSTLAVTLAMAPNWEGATLACTGGLTEAAVAGVATFTGCSISAPGERLYLVATADGVEPYWGFPIDVWDPGSPEGPNLGVVEASSNVITWGDAVDVRVRMQPLAAGQSVAGRVVRFEVTYDPYDPETWRTIGSGTTDSTGTAWFRGYRPPDNRYYRAVFDGAAGLGPAISIGGARVLVRQKVALAPSTYGQIRTVARGTSISFRAVVRPLRASPAPGAVQWQVWHTVNGRVTFSTRTTIPDAKGNAYLTVRFTSGTWAIEARALPTTANANSVWVVDRYRVP